MRVETQGGQPLGIPGEMTLIHHPLVPYDPKVALYFAAGSVVLPFECTGWQDEVMSCKETCYISHSLNPMPTFRTKGRDAVKFLSRVCVNDFERWPVGTGKHAIMCDERGFDMGDGVMLRLAEDEFISYEMGANYIAYAFETGEWGADGSTVGEILSGKVFHYQIAGPRSLEVLGGLGTEVTVVWGDPGTRQKHIRATVSRFPYLNENRNEVFDVSGIPRPRERARE